MIEKIQNICELKMDEKFPFQSKNIFNMFKQYICKDMEIICEELILNQKKIAEIKNTMEKLEKNSETSILEYKNQLKNLKYHEEAVEKYTNNSKNIENLLYDQTESDVIDYFKKCMPLIEEPLKLEIILNNWGYKTGNFQDILIQSVKREYNFITDDKILHEFFMTHILPELLHMTVRREMGGKIHKIWNIRGDMISMENITIEYIENIPSFEDQQKIFFEKFPEYYEIYLKTQEEIKRINLEKQNKIDEENELFKEAELKLVAARKIHHENGAMDYQQKIEEPAIETKIKKIGDNYIKKTTENSTIGGKCVKNEAYEIQIVAKSGNGKTRKFMKKIVGKIHDML